MNHRHLSAFSIAALVWMAPAAPAQQVQSNTADVEGIYLKGYMLVLEAEKLEERNNFSGAFSKYQQAGQIIDGVARSYPNWQPQMVNFRRNLIRQKMAETRQRDSEQRQATAAASGYHAGSSGDLLPPLDGGAPFSDAPPPPATVRPAPRTAASAVDARLNQLQSNISAYSSQAADLQRGLQQKEDELFQVRQKLRDSMREASTALKRQIELQGRLDTADARRQRETSALKKQLEETTTALQEANTLQQEANTKVDALLTELTTARETITQLTKEKDELAAERVQMLALIQGDDGAATLLAENKRLREQLEEANSRVAVLQTDKDTAVKEATVLREQITKLNDDLARTRKENEEYRDQIAGLTTKLEETSRQLLAAPVAKDDSELAHENQMLRQMLVEQLKHQSFRERKKRLALEQLAKLQIANEELLTTIEEIAAPPAALSEEETRRLQDPVIDRFKENQGMSATLLTKADDGALSPLDREDSGTPARAPRGRQDLSSDLQVVAEAGLAELRRKQPDKAQRAFQTILEEDPSNVFVLSNMAVAQMERRDYNGAIRNLRKALAYKEDDAFCHYMLGVASYRQGRLEDAATSLVNSLDFNPQNSRAHFYLGCVFNKRGDLDQAREEFEKSVAAEPGFGDAHYNLAAIYANQGEVEKAAQHYKRALENGSPPDPQLEQALGLDATNATADTTGSRR